MTAGRASGFTPHRRIMATADTEATGVRLVLVGSGTPVGAEVKRRLAESALPVRSAVLAEFDAEDEEGGRKLGEFRGEAVLVDDVAGIEFEKFDLAIVCGPAAECAAILGPAKGAGMCIDLSGAARDRDDATWFLAGLQPQGTWPRRGLVAAPQPAAATLATLLAPLARERWLEGVVAIVLAPASELGEKAVEELYQQSVALLNFSEFPRERLGAQLAFNLLSWDRPSRSDQMGMAEDLSRDVARLLPSGGPHVDVELLLAPTFHGYGYCLHLRLAKDIDTEKLKAAFVAGGVRVSPEGPASPVEVMHDGITRVSRIRRVRPATHWIWAVADSLGEGAAGNVVRLAQHLATPMAAVGTTGRRGRGASSRRSGDTE
jgi:aspartate-semialdehyde dehydrogenase